MESQLSDVTKERDEANRLRLILIECLVEGFDESDLKGEYYLCRIKKSDIEKFKSELSVQKEERTDGWTVSGQYYFGF